MLLDIYTHQTGMSMSMNQLGPQQDQVHATFGFYYSPDSVDFVHTTRMLHSFKKQV